MGKNMKSKWLIGVGLAGCLVLGILIYLIIALLSVSRTELVLAELKNSWQQEKICHEECAKGRREKMAELIEGLRSEPGSRASKLLQAYFLEENGDRSFRAQLLQIILAVNGPSNPPEYVSRYLESPNGDLRIKAEIISSFRPDSLLHSTAAASPLDYYFTLLAGPEAIELKLAAVNAISNFSGKGEAFIASQVEIIKQIVLDPTTDHRLRQSLVLLLGDYYPLFPGEVSPVLQAVYQNEASGDDISRAFASDILNRRGGTELALPEISDAQWDQYYNN